AVVVRAREDHPVARAQAGDVGGEEDARRLAAALQPRLGRAGVGLAAHRRQDGGPRRPAGGPVAGPRVGLGLGRRGRLRRDDRLGRLPGGGRPGRPGDRVEAGGRGRGGGGGRRGRQDGGVGGQRPGGGRQRGAGRRDRRRDRDPGGGRAAPAVV